MTPARRSVRVRGAAVIAATILLGLSGCDASNFGNGDSVTTNGVTPGPPVPSSQRSASPFPDAHCTGECINPGPALSGSSAPAG